MISKMKPPEEGGSRLAIVFNGSPALHRGGWLGGVRDPALDHRERLAGGRRRASRPALLQHRHLHLLLGRDQPEDAGTAGARCNWSTPGSTGSRCARASVTSARRSARGADRGDDPPVRGLRRKGSRSRSSPTRPSASSGSPSSGPCGSATRLPKPHLPALTETKAWAKLSQSQQAEVKAHLADLQGFSTVDRRTMERKLGAFPKGLDKALWEAVSRHRPRGSGR